MRLCQIVTTVAFHVTLPSNLHSNVTLPIVALNLVPRFHRSSLLLSVSLSFDRQLPGPIDKEVNLSLTSLWAGLAVALTLREGGGDGRGGVVCLHVTRGH